MATVLALALLPLSTTRVLAQDSAARPGENPPAPGLTGPDGSPGVTLLDGKTVRGQIVRVENDGVVLSSRKSPIPFYEIQELHPTARSEKEKKVLFDRGPIVRFRSGETLAARVLLVEGDIAKLRIVGPTGIQIPDMEVPVESIQAFRLREAHQDDPLFEDDLKKSSPAEDTVYARRGVGLLRIAGMFRGLTAEHLLFEIGGQRGNIRRQRVQGLMAAPVASKTPEPDPPATFEIVGAGRLPGYLRGVELEKGSATGAKALRVRLPGAPRDALQRLPVAAVRRVTFASDRVLFLSQAQPVAVEETPVLGRAFPYRKDLSVSGDPLRLGGRTYRRGLGVHSRCALEYVLGGRYRSFAAVIGIDDSAGGRGSVTFRVLADGKELFKREKTGASKPEPISLPMDGVERLRLEVDFGADGLDVGDHADWADARVSR